MAQSGEGFPITKSHHLEGGTMRAFLTASILTIAVALFNASAQAEAYPAFEQHLRKALRSEQSRRRAERPAVLAASFAGAWSGRFTFVPSLSTCSTSVTSILFRHQVALRGRTGLLATNHAGSFAGSSRDGGRSYQFVKGVNTSSGYFLVGVGYGNLSSSGRTAIIVHLVEHVGSGCKFAYGTLARR